MKLNMTKEWFLKWGDMDEGCITAMSPSAYALCKHNQELADKDDYQNMEYVCVRCKGTGLDKDHHYPDAKDDHPACETCQGYGVYLYSGN